MIQDIHYTTASLPGLEVLSCRSNHHFTNHLHDGYVLWLNSEAGEHFSIGNQNNILQPGCISIIEPATIHANHPMEGQNRHLRSFYLSLDFLHSLDTMLDSFGASNTLRTIILHDKNLWAGFTSLHQRLFEKAEPMEIECAVIQLFSRLPSNRHNLSATCSGEDQRIKQVIDYFHASLSEKITLEKVAQLTGCSQYHLIRLFDYQLGISPHAYLVQLRLEAARKLLLTGITISDTAFQTGFADQSHLTRQFRQRFGTTPANYQKQVCTSR